MSPGLYEFYIFIGFCPPPGWDDGQSDIQPRVVTNGSYGSLNRKRQITA
jgi:hypothetical protein